jgi:hypothetical protein
VTLRDLVRKAAELGVVLPTAVTLAKYGWDLRAWLQLLADQGWGCGVCGRLPSTGRLVTDHLHVKGWKKLPPEERTQYVRGLLCFFCNRFLLGVRVNLTTARNVLAYLERFEKRRPR